MRIGVALSSEEWGPRDLVALGRRAEESGFHALWISDHFHPWIDEQGHSPFVWSVIGALAYETNLRVTTGVTCPTVRIHPAIVAQATATSQLLLEGRFGLGVGSGEALNEHVLGDHWPEADVRLEMLEEAVEVIRGLWAGEQYSHYGKHYTVENARLYDAPGEPPPVIVSGFGPKAIELAARIGDGFATTQPNAEHIELYRSSGGKGPVQAGGKVCFGADEKQCAETVKRLWPNVGIPGELAQILPNPAHFEQAGELVEAEQLAEAVPCGPDIDRHVEALQEYADAGVDELFVQQIGPDQDAFFDTWAKEILPRFS
jgi:G6PDH family F420-dependent oxidoreductase